MGEIGAVERVKLIVGTLTAFTEILDVLKPHLEKKFGPSDYESALIPFTATSYYAEEMGESLFRRFYSFKKLVDPAELSEIKRWTNDREKRFPGCAAARPVNLDPGYVTLAKLVLASTKDFAHRVAIGGGIYAEVTLVWSQKSFTWRETTYPDYRTREYVAFFNKVRQIYVEQLALR